MEMGKMVAKWLTERQDIIQIYDHEMVKKFEKLLIHQMLKGKGCIGQSKGYNNSFEESKTCQECRERLARWCYLYLVIPWAKNIFNNQSEWANLSKKSSIYGMG